MDTTETAQAIRQGLDAQPDANPTNGPPTDDDRRAGIARDLTAAAELIEGAMRRLNTRSTPCKECGRPHFENYLEANAASPLGSSAAKLRRWAAAVTNPEEYTARGTHREDADELQAVRRGMRSRFRGGRSRR